MIDTREIATAKIIMLGGNGGGGGTSNYNNLSNKPSINGVTLGGNKTSADLNISGMPENPLATSHGGTGNADGYIRKGVAQGSTVGNGATAEGYGNTVSGDYSHAEGSGNTASSYHTHAEGSTTTASAPQAHAQGYGTTASGAHSHAGGNGTVAGYADQTAIGKFNDNKGTTLFEVGNGADASHKSNAFEVYSNGNIVAGGTVSDANGVLNAVGANMPDAPVALLNKLKIGSIIYDATAVKPYTVSSITSGTTGVIRVNTISTNSIDGDLIAITTGSNSGTTTNAWALTFYDGGTLSPLELKKADGTGYTDAITENQLLFVIPDLSNSSATVVDVAGASGSGDEPVIPVLNKESVYSLNDVNSISKTFTAGYTSAYMVILTVCNAESLPTISTATVTVNGVAQEVKTYYASSGYGVNSKYALLDLEAGDTVAASLTSAVSSYGTSTSIALVRLSSAIRDLTLIASDFDSNVDDPVIDENVNDDGLYLLFFFDRHDGVGSFKTLKHNNVNITQNKIVCSSGSSWQVSHGMCIVSAKAMDNFKASVQVNGYFTAVGIMSLSSSAGNDTALTDLTDTDITNPTDGQVLTYNGTTGKWGNQTPSGVAESVVGTAENGATASKAYAVGEHFIRNDKFCTVIAAIASGATLTLNTNYVEGTIAEAVANKYNYSTTEHVCGTWIDGKTLYERTFEAGYLPNSTYTFYSTGIPISSFPLTNIKRIFGIAVSSSDVLPLPFANGGQNSQAYDAGLAPANASGYFAFYMCCGIDRSNYKVYATVQYTKS